MSSRNQEPTNFMATFSSSCAIPLSTRAIFSLQLEERLSKTSSGELWAVPSSGTKYFSSRTTKAHARFRERHRADPGSFVARPLRQSVRSAGSLDRHGERPILGESAVAETRLSGYFRRALLHGRVQESIAVRAAKRHGAQTAWSIPAANLLNYIPAPNLPGNVFLHIGLQRDSPRRKIGERMDANTSWGTIFAYYSLDNYTENNPYPTAQGGANVPGFNALNTGRAQLAVLGYTKTFGASAVNDFQLSYTRDANDLGKPVGGLGVSLASQGFVTGAGTLGIVPLGLWKPRRRKCFL